MDLADAIVEEVLSDLEERFPHNASQELRWSVYDTLVEKLSDMQNGIDS